MNWNVITDAKCCQGNIRRIVLADKLAAKIGDSVSFTIPTGAIGPKDKLKLFVGFNYTCPNELKVSVNGTACYDADFGMDSYKLLQDPTTLAYTIATYSLTLDNADPAEQTVTISGNPLGEITYLELKVVSL